MPGRALFGRIGALVAQGQAAEFATRWLERVELAVLDCRGVTSAVPGG